MCTLTFLKCLNCYFIHIAEPNGIRKRSYENMDFYIGIPKHYTIGIPTGYYLYISTLSSNSITYSIENSSGIITEGSISSDSGVKISLNTFLTVRTPSYMHRNLGIHLHTTGPISVLVVSYGEDLNGIGQYPAIPYESLDLSEYVYFAVSTGSNANGSYGQILLIANENVNITITPTINVNVPVDPQTDSGTEILSSWTSKSMTMKELQTILIVAEDSTADLSGSKIVSTKPLTVVTGHECGTIPLSVGYCETIMEQIPPVSNLGKQFLLSPYKDRGSQYYKIIAVENGVTEVNHNCLEEGSFTLDAAGSFNNFETLSDTFCYLESDKPILVIQMSPGTLKDNKLGDPAISILPPMEKYIKATSFYAPQLDDIDTAYVNIVSKKKAMFHLDKVELPLKWNTIVNTNNKKVGFVAQVASISTETTHNITCPTEVEFYTLVYGFGEKKAYSFTPGLCKFCLYFYTVASCFYHSVCIAKYSTVIQLFI